MHKMYPDASSLSASCLPWFLKLLQSPLVWLNFDKVQTPLRLPRKKPHPDFKNAPRPPVFNSFDMPKMCFAPPSRSLFQHPNFQKWSESEVLLTFWLGHVLHAAAACTFFTSHLPKLPPQRCAIFDLSSREMALHRRFSEPTFRPSGATKHWKTQCFCNLSTVSRYWLFLFWLFLFSDCSQHCRCICP